MAVVQSAIEVAGLLAGLDRTCPIRQGDKLEVLMPPLSRSEALAVVKLLNTAETIHNRLPGEPALTCYRFHYREAKTTCELRMERKNQQGTLDDFAAYIGTLQPVLGDKKNWSKVRHGRGEGYYTEAPAGAGDAPDIVLETAQTLARNDSKYERDVQLYYKVNGVKRLPGDLCDMPLTELESADIKKCLVMTGAPGRSVLRKLGVSDILNIAPRAQRRGME